MSEVEDKKMSVCKCSPFLGSKSTNDGVSFNHHLSWYALP